MFLTFILHPFPAHAVLSQMQLMQDGVYDVQAGSYTNYFADALIAEAERDVRVVGIHAAMGGGTGMNRFEQRFAERTFDVGIAEQVTLAHHSDGLLSACFCALCAASSRA